MLLNLHLSIRTTQKIITGLFYNIPFLPKGDENNWDFWNANIYKEPTSPAEIAPAFYPMSSSCGQLGQSYEDCESHLLVNASISISCHLNNFAPLCSLQHSLDDCEDACPKDSLMEITGSTNAKWIGAPYAIIKCGSFVFLSPSIS